MIGQEKRIFLCNSDVTDQDEVQMKFYLVRRAPYVYILPGFSLFMLLLSNICPWSLQCRISSPADPNGISHTSSHTRIVPLSHEKPVPYCMLLHDDVCKPFPLARLLTGFNALEATSG